MTLCIAHKINEKVVLASDSRISLGDRYSDFAVKVVPIMITVTSASDSETGNSSTLYSSTFGLAFAGSFAAQNAIKDFLVIALQKLQFVPSFGPLSFERICGYVGDLYKHVANKLSSEIGDLDAIDFLFCGFCPLLKKNLVAKFQIEYDENLTVFKPQYHIFSNERNFPIAIGSGSDRFINVFNSFSLSNGFFRAIKAMKNVIDDQEIPSVGGNIQYGEISEDLSFTICGMVIPELNADGSTRSNHFFLGGIDVLDDVFDEMNGLLMTGSFIYPFR